MQRLLDKHLQQKRHHDQQRVARPLPANYDNYTYVAPRLRGGGGRAGTGRHRGGGLLYVAVNSEGLAAQVSHLSYNLELARRTVRRRDAHDASVMMYPVHIAYVQSHVVAGCGGGECARRCIL